LSEHSTSILAGTGTAEVGGWTTRELLTILDSLDGLEVVGADVGMLEPCAHVTHALNLDRTSRGCAHLR